MFKIAVILSFTVILGAKAPRISCEDFDEQKEILEIFDFKDDRILKEWIPQQVRDDPDGPIRNS